jgi:hypothetical protein
MIYYMCDSIKRETLYQNGAGQIDGACFRNELFIITTNNLNIKNMRTILLLLCACMLFIQCSHDDNALKEQAVEKGEQPNTLPGDDPSQAGGNSSEPPPAYTLEDIYRGMDANYDVLYNMAECLLPAKTGQVGDIVGKWKLIMEINLELNENGAETDRRITDRSCENVMYHFKPDQTLTVSGSEEDECNYYFEPFPYCPVCLPLNPTPNLKMGSLDVYSEVLLTKMILYPKLKEGTTLLSSEIQLLFLRIE